MRILYFDIDSLRYDHLGCYGYTRSTSPVIDSLAAQGTRYTRCFTPDAPCLPSRTALFGWKFGLVSGVVNHSGRRAEPFSAGIDRPFRPPCNSWPGVLRQAGYRTATVSSFADRHGAWFWLDGFSQVMDPGGRGHEIADDVEPLAAGWLAEYGREDNWFLHVNYWDAHVPYRTPDCFGNPFADIPLERGLEEQEIERQKTLPGMRSAMDSMYYRMRDFSGPRQPKTISSSEDVKRLYDGYDCGINYVDASIGRILSQLDAMGILDETLIMISADHGESFGEFGGWSAHCFAEPNTVGIPLILCGPGIARNEVDHEFHYSFDIAEKILNMAGVTIPPDWNASYLPEGREYVVCSMLAQCAQRAVGFKYDDRFYWYLWTWHDGWHGLDSEMLFNPDDDPQLRHNLAAEQPEPLSIARRCLEEWRSANITAHGDPLDEVMAEGGPEMVRKMTSDEYELRLRQTGR